MKVVKKISLNSKVVDMLVDKITEDILLLGNKTLAIQKDRVKILPKKLFDSSSAEFIKSNSQLFFTSQFLIATNNGNIYKCDLANIKSPNQIDNIKGHDIKVDHLGNIIFRIKDELFVRDLNMNTINTKIEGIDNFSKYIFKIETDRNIIVKYRKQNTFENIIQIYEPRKLKKLFEIKIPSSHIFFKIIDTKYYAINIDNQLEVWDILEGNLKTVIGFDDLKINYFVFDNNVFYFSTSKGEIFQTDEKFNKKDVLKVSKFGILKIDYSLNKIFILDENNTVIFIQKSEEK